MTRLLLVLVVFVLAACAGPGGAAAVTSSRPQALATAQPPAPPRLRLPDTARPLRNAATLTIVPTHDAFDGDMQIELDVRATLPMLWLNADGLKLDRADATTPAGVKSEARIVAGDRNFVGLAFDPPLAPGKATVHIGYRGALSKLE